ncbi:MAG: uroporphyrinogen decarboxylase family protein [Candidatus Firestonebacteria bacterium]
MDFKKHNEEVKIIWDAYYARKPIRVPMKIAANARVFLLDPKLNKNNISFKEYFENPEIMLNVQVQFEKWKRFNLTDDSEMGLPEKWTPGVDMQNVVEACWYGARINYRENQCPDTEPILAGDKKNLLFDRGIPDPMSGIHKTILEYIEYYKKKAKEGVKYEGLEINGRGRLGAWTEGVITAAMNLRGSEILLDIYEDPEYVHKLFDFIAEATIKKARYFREYYGEPLMTEDCGLGDDSIALLSVDMMKEFVLPYLKKIYKALSTGKKPTGTHLCGDATRHFKTFMEEVYTRSFETGFPVDFTWLRKEVGPDVEIIGGPKVSLLLDGSKEEVRKETERILASGIMEGGRFILREGNNLAPRTPLENISAMYEACKEQGKYR